MQVSIAYCEFLEHIEANLFDKEGIDNVETVDLIYLLECVLRPPAELYTNHLKPAFF